MYLKPNIHAVSSSCWRHDDKDIPTDTRGSCGFETWSLCNEESVLTLNLLGPTTVGARINPYATNIYIYIYMEHPFLMSLDHTQQHTTVGGTPLDEWSARRRDLYLTTHDTQNRQISMPSVGFKPTISAGERQGRSPAEIVGSNPTGGMDICLLWVSCVVR